MWTGRETRGVIKSWDGSEARFAQSVEYACMYPCAVCVCVCVRERDFTWNLRHVIRPLW